MYNVCVYPQTFTRMCICGVAIRYYRQASLASTSIVVGHCVRLSVRLFVCPFVRPKRRDRFNSLRISANSLKFGEMMYSTTQQIAIKDFLPVPWNFEISRIGKGEVRGMTLPCHLFKYFNYRPKISGMMHSTIKQITGSNDHSRPILALSMEIWSFGTFPEYARTRSDGRRYCSNFYGF